MCHINSNLHGILLKFMPRQWKLSATSWARPLQHRIDQHIYAIFSLMSMLLGGPIHYTLLEFREIDLVVLIEVSDKHYFLGFMP